MREQRKLSRKLEANVDHYETVIGIDKKEHRKAVWKKPLKDCRNIQKQKQKVKLIHKKLKDQRTNYVHQVTAEIVGLFPQVIVLEDLQVRNMMKNHALAKAISEQMWSEFRRQITYKAKMKGIEVVIADLFFPSSKTCSHCGSINNDLELKDRVYVCPVCGHVIDRDYNASLNLADYYTSGPGQSEASGMKYNLVQG